MDHSLEISRVADIEWSSSTCGCGCVGVVHRSGTLQFGRDKRWHWASGNFSCDEKDRLVHLGISSD